MTKKAIAELSIETSLLYQRIAAMQPDELLSYTEASAIISADVQNGARHHLDAARRKALHNDDVVTDCVVGEGIKRLKDTDIVGVGMAGITKTRRLMRRTQEKLTAVQDFDAMPEAKKREHNSILSITGALLHFAKPKALAKVSTAIEGPVLSIGKVLQLMK